MAQSARADRRVQAQAAVNRAMEGQLIQLRSYSLRHQNGQFLIGVPPTAPRNVPVEIGDELDSYLDKENGFIVYDLGPGIGGDDSDGEQ